MKPRRRLGDLYVRGKEVSVDDGSGDPVVFWLQKLNEIEREAVMRKATAAKARFSIDADHDEGELFVSTLGSVREYLERDAMIELIIAEDVSKARERIEEQLAHDEDGWGKDDKITSLLEAWTGTADDPGLAAAYAEDENDPEAVKVKAELDAFEDQVVKRVTDEREHLEHEWENTTDADLARHAAKEVLKRRADDAFMREYLRQQTFYCVRELDDHHKRYFGTVGEVDDLDDRIRSFLESQCAALSVSSTEGKDLPARPAPSNSSESTSEVEVSKDSGPVTVNA